MNIDSKGWEVAVIVLLVVASVYMFAQSLRTLL